MKFVSMAPLLAVLAPSLALAHEPQFGRWAVDPQHCSGATKAGPLVVTANSVNLAAESCTIGKMYKADRALYIEARCSSGGTMTRHPITLAMKGEHLAVTWNGEHTDMKRCP